MPYVFFILLFNRLAFSICYTLIKRLKEWKIGSWEGKKKYLQTYPIMTDNFFAFAFICLPENCRAAIKHTWTHWGRAKVVAISLTTFSNENVWILLNISPKFVPRVRINNIPTLIQIMAWRQPGDKPLFEPMMVNLLTHICVTRPHWVNSFVVNIVVENIYYISYTHDMTSKTYC